jgi:acyl-CoA synthetase (AMP-forming)/AMP-acid ligase II
MEKKFESIVEAIFYHAKKTPDALFAADGKQSYTYEQARNAIIKSAWNLNKSGVHKGDMVVVECNQTAAYCVMQQAIALTGAVFVPYDRKIASDRLAEIIDESSAVCLVGINSNFTDLPFVSINSVTPDSEQVDFAFEFPHSDQRSELLYSTGTTGKAKGIDLTHGNNVALANNIASGVGMEDGNIEMIPVSLSHSHGLRTLYANFLKGNGVVISPGVTFLKPFFSLLEQYHSTAIDLVPSACRILCAQGAERLSAFQDQIRYVELGSAPLTDEDKQLLHKLLPKSRLYNFYGSTESGRTCTYDFAANPNKTNCIGKPVPNAEVLVVDENQQIINHSSPEHTGYLAFRGPMNMSGYWNNPELTATIMKNGIIYTKDIGYIDEDGWIYMLGRDDDIINFGGVKINPLDIEKIAIKCPGVLDCGCVGRSNQISGQEPWLFIQLDKSLPDDKEIVSAWLMKNLDREKMPKRIIEIENMPRTFNGKLLRKNLKEIAENM